MAASVSTDTSSGAPPAKERHGEELRSARIDDERGQHRSMADKPDPVATIPNEKEIGT